MKTPPEVGQILYSLNVNNAARGREQKLTPCVVTKVGIKYFTAQNQDDDSGYSARQYHLDSWQAKTQWLPVSKLYSSPEEWREEEEARVLCKEIEDSFRYSARGNNLPLPVLRKIYDLIFNRPK